MFNAKVYTVLKYLKILPLKVVGWFSRMCMFGKLPQGCNGELKLIKDRRQGMGVGIHNCIQIFHLANNIQRLTREAMEKDISGPISTN